jgi:hypothetical protein
MKDTLGRWFLLLLLGFQLGAATAQEHVISVAASGPGSASTVFSAGAPADNRCTDTQTLDLNECDLGRTVEQMRKFLVFNATFHNGFVLDHSIWTGRGVANWFAQNDDWVADIPKDLEALAVLLAFLHDVGKVGDDSVYIGRNGSFQVKASYQMDGPGADGLVFNWKESEPREGFEYVMGAKDFDWIASDCEECVPQYCEYLLRACPMSCRELSILAVGVGMHYSFGDYVRQPPEIDEFDYLERLRDHLCEAKQVWGYFPQAAEIGPLVRLFSVIGAADVQGAHPVSLIDHDDRDSSQFLGRLGDPRARYALEPASSRPYVKYEYENKRENMEMLADYVSKRWAELPDCP